VSRPVIIRLKGRNTGFGASCDFLRPIIPVLKKIPRHFQKNGHFPLLSNGKFQNAGPFPPLFPFGQPGPTPCQYSPFSAIGGPQNRQEKYYFRKTPFSVTQ
jgi:hypothetical protein